MRKLPIIGIAVLLMVGLSIRVWAGTKVHIGTDVAKSAQVSMDQINHDIWDGLLQKFCNERGFVNYEAWMKSSADARLLDEYLTNLSHANPKLQASQASQFAFWINAYNAVTVKGILREYPTTSIRNHTPKLVGYNIWHDLLLKVGGQDFSLDQIEHKVLRPMGDPRIHFAIVCASIGCPPLANRAYTADGLDDQLTQNAKQFFADPQKFAATADGTLKLSQILQWFSKDFGPNQAALLRSIAPYLPTSAAQELANSGKARVSYLEYDWDLNDQASLAK